MTVKTRKAPRIKNVPISVQPVPELFPPIEAIESNEIEKTAEELLKGASEVRVRISWFGTSAKVDEENAKDMLKDTDADRSSVSISKRLLRTKHQALQVVKEARKAIDEHIRGWTIPMMALKLTDTNASGEEGVTRKDAGIRLIQKKDMAQFDERLSYLTELLRTATKSLQHALPEIKEEDRERLGKLFRDTDYPTDITNLIGIECSYKQVGADIDWETLCPAIYERERFNARKRFEAVVDNAAAEFAERFVRYVKQVVDQLGNRTRLNPLPDKNTITAIGADDKSLQVDVTDAEVLSVLDHSHDEEIPIDHVLLQLRLSKGDNKGRSTEVWMAAPITTKDYYAHLRPQETSERKKLYASTIDNLKSEMDAFINIGNMLGPYQSVIAESVNNVKNMLSKASHQLNTDAISKALREGDYFRNEMATVLKGVVNSVADAVGTVKVKRRSIKKSLIGQV